jgi:hypothetical protein
LARVSAVERIDTDIAGLADALYRGATFAREGIAFDVRFRFPNDRSTVANLAARDIVAREADPRSRLAAFDALGAHDARLGTRMLEDFSTVPMAPRGTARDLLALARALRVSANTQWWRATFALDMPLRHILVRPTDALVPAPPTVPLARGERAVVWAPQRRTEDFVLVLAGVCAEADATVDVVCAGGSTFGYDVALHDVAAAPRLLAEAAVIVTTEPENPAADVALVRWGLPLCSPSTNGANMWLRGLTTYRPWSRADITLAVSIARGQPAPSDIIFPDVTLIDDPEPATDGPLVRIIVRSDNERPCAVTSDALARLRYAVCEVVVCGSDRDAEAAARADGAVYTVTIEDGDALYPASIGRFVDALERSGEDRARGDALITYLAEAPGPPMALGHAVAGAHQPGDAEREPIALRTMVRRVPLNSRPAPLTVRVAAVVGSVHRFIDGRSAFFSAAPARADLFPATRLSPPQPLRA